MTFFGNSVNTWKTFGNDGIIETEKNRLYVLKADSFYPQWATDSVMKDTEELILFEKFDISSNTLSFIFWNDNKLDFPQRNIMLERRKCCYF